MKAKLIHEANGLRTFAVVLQIGDEISQSLQIFAESERLSAAQVTAIGAFEKATVTFWVWETRDYEDIPVNEQVEVLSLNGDITLDASGKPKLHLHTVLGRRDGSTMGGHLKTGHVRPTLEIIVTEAPAHLRRKHDPVSGLPLISVED
jgi:predicted DNA-binding protein with PD1-like motif